MRLELTILAALAPQASVYTIPPSGQVLHSAGRVVRVVREGISHPVNSLCEFTPARSILVPPAGVEPAHSGLSGLCFGEV